LMRSCWATERVDRPRFVAVVHLLDRLIRSPELLRELAKPRSVMCRLTLYVVYAYCSSALRCRIYKYVSFPRFFTLPPRTFSERCGSFARHSVESLIRLAVRY